MELIESKLWILQQFFLVNEPVASWRFLLHSQQLFKCRVIVGICSICQMSWKPKDIKKSFYHLTVFHLLMSSSIDPLEEIPNKDTDQGINLEGLQRQETKLSINNSEDFWKANGGVENERACCQADLGSDSSLPIVVLGIK